MATTMDGSFTVPADKATVWDKLTDPEVLRACITGCQTLEKTSPTTYVATAKMKIGPVSASFKGKVELQDVDAPNSCRIVGEGEGGIAGFAKGAANVKLMSVPDGTAVTYAVEANVGGKIAQLGGRLIDGVAKKMADQFFTAFAAAVAPKQTAE